MGKATTFRPWRIAGVAASAQKVYQAVAAVSLRSFVRALVARRAELEPDKARMSIDIKTGGRHTLNPKP